MGHKIVTRPPYNPNQPRPPVDISGKVDKVAGKSLVTDTEITKIHTVGSDNQDLSNLVVKVTGSSLVADTEISKIHALGSDNQDLSNLVVKISGSSLVADTEIAKIHTAGSDNQDLSELISTSDPRLTDSRTPLTHSHDYVATNDARLSDARTPLTHSHANDHASGSDNQDLSNLVVKVTGSSLMTDASITDLTDGGETTLHTHAGSGLTLSAVKADTDIASAISLKHSNSNDHAAGSDNQDLSGKVDKITNYSLVLNTEISKIHSNALDHTTGADQGLDTGGANAVTAAQAKAGYTHSGVAHAPSTAQANTDITKAEIEAKLTGTISSHSHTGGSGDVVGPASATGDNIAVFNLTTGKLIKDGGATIASKENTGVAASAVSSHAALQTGVHGLSITAGQSLTVTSGGTLGSAAYTASTAYATSGQANATHTGDVTGATVLAVAESYSGSKCLTSNFTTSSVTAVSTNLAFAIAASAVYDVDVYGTCSKATSATGIKFAINCPASCDVKGVQYGGMATLAAPPVPSLITAINTLGTALATGIGIQVGFHLHFRVVNSTNVGNITIQVATVTSNIATVYAGTKINWCKSVQV